MNNNTGLILGALAIAVIAGFVGYLLGTQKEAVPSLSQTQQTAQVTQEKVAGFKTVIIGEQNESGQVGVATLRDDNGKVRVNLQFVGTPEGSKQPAHIHTGSCPNPGAVVYPLTDVVDGKSETLLETTMDQLDSRIPLAINVHKSATEQAVYVGCGNLPD